MLEVYLLRSHSDLLGWGLEMIFGEMGNGDYTRDREEWLNGLTVGQVVEEIKGRRVKQKS